MFLLWTCGSGGSGYNNTVGSRSNRLALQRVRERARYQRVAVVMILLVVLALVVPSLSRPTSSADVLLERMVEQERLAQRSPATAPAEDRASADSPVAPEDGAAASEAVQPALLPEVIPITEVGELFVPIGRLEIPKIGLTVDVRNGVHDRILETGVGYWPGTGTDNLVLSGHRTTYLHPFRDLDLLATQDQITYVSGGEAPTTYEVFETRIVPEAEYVDVVLGGTPEPDDRVITMFACYPKGSRTHRIVVRARAVTQVAGSVEAPGGL